MYVYIHTYNVFYALGARARLREHQERALHARSACMKGGRQAGDAGAQIGIGIEAERRF